VHSPRIVVWGFPHRFLHFTTSARVWVQHLEEILCLANDDVHQGPKQRHQKQKKLAEHLSHRGSARAGCWPDEHGAKPLEF
jgi:hypothetical protein